MLPERVMELLAIDVGLVVITSWFLILFFMFREFRIVSRSVNNLTSHLNKDEYLPIYQESVDDALASVNKHTETLNELTSVHEIIESQLEILHQSQTNPQDDGKITQLEAQLDKSHALIKKLKGELASSKKRLEHTKVKLYSQNDAVDLLQKEKEQFLLDAQKQQADFEHNQELQAQAEKYKSQQKQLVAAAGDYKSKLVKQSKELDYVKKKNQLLTISNSGTKTDSLNKKINALEKQLKDSNEKAGHIIKEKDFLETKFLDSLKQIDELKGNDKN
ncbi:hypothetical protein [Pseudoalteromonas denitrificans]|uniref:Chromosome partitioning protein ParA n=1 Tax=Pseudoalteromonas denitrificans DSM 6059 TaxID=1123010 RepID=A0A1I1T4H6_9GAMM|nr:hypothetical protein [Pseudoalteromonas denitrificans]SFD53605.1 hypothetical protein SAMN02745724_04785 [Pseudoalteromonas denitrificans DSM 6059]